MYISKCTYMQICVCTIFCCKEKNFLIAISILLSDIHICYLAWMGGVLHQWHNAYIPRCD